MTIGRYVTTALVSIAAGVNADADEAVLYSSGPATITTNGSGTTFSVGNWPALEVVASVTGAVSGTTPTLNVVLDGFDAFGNAYYIGGFGTAITAAGNYSYAVGPGTGNEYNPPATAQVTWAVTGTTPSFGGVEITVYGRQAGGEAPGEQEGSQGTAAGVWAAPWPVTIPAGQVLVLDSAGPLYAALSGNLRAWVDGADDVGHASLAN
jgi:hypothetical protein